MVEYFLMTLDLGVGRYEEALGHGRTLLNADPLYVCSLSLADLVEAAVRADAGARERRRSPACRSGPMPAGHRGASGYSPAPRLSWPMTLVPNRST